jgi:ribosome-binding factor A
VSIRTERVGEEIKKVLSERMLRGLRDPLPGFVTIAAVMVTSDFSMATVHVSVIGSEKDKKGALDVLADNRGALRSAVGKAVRLRQTPDLRFVLDETAEKAARVHALLDEAKERDPALAKVAPAPTPQPEVPARAAKHGGKPRSGRGRP